MIKEIKTAIEKKQPLSDEQLKFYHCNQGYVEMFLTDKEIEKIKNGKPRVTRTNRSI